jgi:hypothetical protein
VNEERRTESLISYDEVEELPKDPKEPNHKQLKKRERKQEVIVLQPPPKEAKQIDCVKCI